MTNETTRTQQYCPHCEQVQPVVQTVPWQEDLCRACSNGIPWDGD